MPAIMPVFAVKVFSNIRYRSGKFVKHYRTSGMFDALPCRLSLATLEAILEVFVNIFFAGTGVLNEEKYIEDKSGK